VSGSVEPVGFGWGVEQFGERGALRAAGDLRHVVGADDRDRHLFGRTQPLTVDAGHIINDIERLTGREEVEVVVGSAESEVNVARAHRGL